jgi:phosphoribosylformylglycinamidine synthase
VGLDVDLDDWSEDPLEILFNEELGAVMQVKTEKIDEFYDILEEFGLSDFAFEIASLNPDKELRFWKNEDSIVNIDLKDVIALWSKTSLEMAKIRDNPECAEQEYQKKLDMENPGLHVALTYDQNETWELPSFRGGKPKVAILREQGVNGQIEMAAAFDRAGFAAVDVHMSDLLLGHVQLESFQGLVACGGFSYGDVLGAGEGWAKSILFNSVAREQFIAFFERPDTFTLGVCNGCQMLSNLKELIPGASNWPHFVQNKSERFEARFAMVEVKKSNSILFAGMEGSRMPITVSHGEGLAEFENDNQLQSILDNQLMSLGFIDERGMVTENYPSNPNGSPLGLTGLTTPDGRVTIMMPHPERVFRASQHSWKPDDWNENGPWLRLFMNARKWVQQFA